jgi:sortase A
MSARAERPRIIAWIQFVLLTVLLLTVTLYVSRVATRASASAQDKQRIEQARAAPATAVRKPRNGDPYGVIRVPRLRLEANLREGVDDGTLKLAAGRIPGSSATARKGNLAFAAHRDTHFRPLQHIRLRDEIALETVEGSFRYSVTDLVIVQPEDTWVLNATSKPTLTLVTCYPFTFVGNAPRRFVVRAVLVGEEPRKDTDTGGNRRAQTSVKKAS